MKLESEDLGEETVAEVVATITDPRKMVGPEVLFSENAARDEAAKVICGLHHNLIPFT